MNNNFDVIESYFSFLAVERFLHTSGNFLEICEMLLFLTVPVLVAYLRELPRVVLSSLGYLPAHVLLSKTFFQPAVRLYAYLVVEKQKVTFRIHSILFFFFFFLALLQGFRFLVP